MAAAPTSYHVVLLVEQALTAADAAQVRSLHEGIEDPVTYHVLLPVEDAAARVEAAMGSLGSGEFLGSPGAMMSEVDLDAVRAESQDRAITDLATTLASLRSAGAAAEGELVSDPVPALAAKVKQVDGREAIVLTRPHVVAEFFHLDWTAQARRAIGVPVLHLIEHETFDEQGEEGSGEGAHLI